MAALTLQDITPAGTVVSYSAVSSSDTVKISTGQRVFLHVNNASGGPIVITITAAKTTATVSGVGSVSIGDLVIPLADNKEKMIGPFTEAYMNTDGDVTIGYDVITSVTAAAVQLPAQY